MPQRSIVQHCTCPHPYQDMVYGKGQGVMNLTLKGDKATCTVCDAERPVTVRAS